MIFLGLFIGITSYIILYLGKGIQKYAIDGLRIYKLIKKRTYRIWIFGTVLTTIYFFLEWVSLIFAPINIIAPLGGVGLLFMLPFSYFILHEEVYNIQLIGSILIIIGTALITIFNPNSSEIYLKDFNLSLLLLSSIPIIIVEMIFILISKFNGYTGAGLIFGLTAGTFNAFQTVTKRISAIPEPLISSVFTCITFIMALLALLFTMYGFSKAAANVVVPCDISADISTAVLISLFAVNERIEIIQIIGIIIIIFGVVFVTGFRKRIKRAPYRRESKTYFKYLK
ncbi:MAG: DMT family transporter [Candidatus Hermodarchaeota archaeon]